MYIGTILDRGTKNTEGVLGQFLSRAQRARLKNFFKCLGEAVSIYRKIVIWGRSPNMTIWPKTSEVFCSKITKFFRIYTRFFVYQAKRKSVWAQEFVICFISQFKNQNKLFQNFIFLSFLSFLPKHQVYWISKSLTPPFSNSKVLLV